MNKTNSIRKAELQRSKESYKLNPWYIFILLLATSWIIVSIFDPSGLSILNIIQGLTLALSFASIFIILQGRDAERRPERLRRSAGYLLLLVTVLYCIMIALRGLSLEFNSLLTMLGNPKIGMLPWVIPLISLYIARGAVFYKFESALYSLLKFSTISFFFILTIYWGNASNITESLPWYVYTHIFFAALPYYLCNSGVKHSPGVIWLGLSSTALVIISLLGGSRATLLLLTMCWGVYTIRSAFRTPLLGFIYFLLIVFVIVIALIYPGQDVTLDSSWFVDTRTFLFVELVSNLSSLEMWFGRGASGSYFSGFFLNDALNGQAGDYFDRQLVEVGLLHYLLKGGLMMVLLYFLASLIAAWKCFFGGIGAGVGSYIIICLIFQMYSHNVFFTLSNLLYWIVVSRVLVGSTKNFQFTEGPRI